MQHLELNLREIWKNEPATKQDSGKFAGGHTFDYPILFPPTNQIKYFQTFGDDQFVITKSNSLMKLPRREIFRGWELLYEKLPRFDQAFIGITADLDVQVLLFQKSKFQVSVVSVNENSVKTVSFVEGFNAQPRFSFYDNKFACFMENNKETFWYFIRQNDHLIIGSEPIPDEKFTQRFVSLPKPAEKWRVSNSGNIFKNINHVFINDENDLVFDRFKLMINESQLRLEKTNFVVAKIGSRLSSGRTFVFPDGSFIKNHEDGVLVFRSSDETLDDIYLNCMIGADLAIVAGNHLGGDPFYHKTESESSTYIHRSAFWSAYIDKFIQKILDHGA